MHSTLSVQSRMSNEIGTHAKSIDDKRCARLNPSVTFENFSFSYRTLRRYTQQVFALLV